MKRRLVIAATALVLVGGAAGIASASTTPTVGAQTAQGHYFCLVFYYQNGSKSYECLDY
jgi:hypothetical protein